MKNTITTVAFRRGLIVPFSGRVSTLNNIQQVASLQAELMNLGFVLEPDACAYLKQLPVEQIAKYYRDVLPLAKELVGAKRSYKPMYVNFPEQVMEMHAMELFLNALSHYASDGTWEPPQELKERGVFFENTEFRSIKLVDEEDFKKIFTKLVSVNTSLTAQDKELVQWFVATYDRNLPMPDRIPFKETLCLLASLGLDVPVTSPTDVLRVAVFASGGDISLPSVPRLPERLRQALDSGSVALVSAKGSDAPSISGGNFDWAFRNRAQTKVAERELFKFKKFNRNERRQLLSLLEKTSLDLSEMQQRLERWLRLGEVLHPQEKGYRRDYPKTYRAFRALRNQKEKIRSYFSLVDMAFNSGDLEHALELLSQRPGEFGRRLDWLMRTFQKSEDIEHVFESFEGVSKKISTKVLLEIYSHLQSRLQLKPRSVSLKRGSKRKKLEPLAPLPEILVLRGQTTILDGLKAHFSKLEPLGKVWIDDRLKKAMLPANMRGANASLVTYVQGTKIPFRQEAKVIRPFVHWYDKNGGIDLDLSVAFIDEQYRTLSHVSFTALRDKKFGAVHSGDIRHRRGSCAEYVDVELETALLAGARYVAVQVHNYNAYSMKSVEECFFGLMEREQAGSNEIFEPKTVSNAISIQNESSTVLICAIDLQEREYIWLDTELDRSLSYIENTFSQINEVLSSVVGSGRLTVYDLLALHADARGQQVSDINEADVRFTLEEFINDYAKVAQFMTA